MQKVIPHFLKYPLLSSKRKDFEKFVAICQMIYEGKHLKEDTLKEIVEFSYQMNGLGARRYNMQEVLKIIR